tara:strand:- start:7296 stop:7667 length:372 start_codon:yes stop_codon:yes gene_type:complete
MSEDQLSTEKMRQSLIDISVESWRFGKLFDRLLTKLDAGEQGRYVGQFRWFQKKIVESLEAAELRAVNLEGQEYDAGMAASAINIDEFEADDLLVVDQMLEPIIMDSNGVVRSGTVTVIKVSR